MHVCVAFFLASLFDWFGLDLFFFFLFSFCFEPNKTNSLLIFAIFAFSIRIPFFLIIINVLNGISTVYTFILIEVFFYSIYLWLPRFNRITFLMCIVSGAKWLIEERMYDPNGLLTWTGGMRLILKPLSSMLV